MKKGFTLIELMGTIALMAVLILLVVPNVVKMFNSASKRLMVSEEGSFKSAAEIFVQDYCIDPLYDDKGQKNVCPVMYYTNNYLCLNTLQSSSSLSKGYIEDIIFKKQACQGVAVFDKTAGKNSYKTVNVYLRCMDETKTSILYQTDSTLVYTNYPACFN